jgi:DNA-binding PadR family transcriptional regulator
MSIRYAILGLLAERPLHGYGLKRVFDQRLSPLWGLTTGQIYQSLNALERVGLIEGRSERSTRRPARRVYSVTEAGRRALDRWLAAAPTAWTRPFRDEMLIRLMLLRDTEAAALSESLARQEHEAMLLLARVTRMRDQARARKLDAAIDLAGVFLCGLAHHLEADIKSLQQFRAEIEARDEHSDVGHRSGDAGVCSALRSRNTVAPGSRSPVRQSAAQ